MALEVGIKVDPQDSLTKANAVEAGLHKVEDRGIAAGKAMLGLAGAFSKLGDAIERERAALDRTTAAHDRLTRANQPLVAAFSKLSEALKREQEMLDRIHGPAQRYAADLQTLDSLLDRNKISTMEYAAEVSKLNRTLEGTPKQGPTSTANHPAAGPGMLGGLRGAAAAVGVSVGVKEVGELANEYQNLQNRLRYLAGGDMQKVNELFGELQGIAQRTRGDLSATTEGFVRMSLATKQMGLSNRETLAFTERLNKAIALSGATGTEAAAGMIQLSQGLASGALRGDELRSVMEQLPAVADVIANGLGVTRGELRALGADGKITAEVIVNAFKKAGTSLDRDFGNTVPTISQSFTLFKNEMIVTVGELDKSIGASRVLGDVLGGLASVIKTLIIPLQLAGEAMGAIGMSGSTAALGMAGFIAAGPVGALAGITVGLLAQAGAFDDVGGAMADMIDRYNKWDELMTAANRNLDDFSGKEMLDAIGALTEYNLQMTLGAAAAEAFTSGLRGTKDAIDRQAQALKAANAMAEAQGLGKGDDMGETLDRNLNKAAHIVESIENARKKSNKTLSEEEKLLKRLHGDYDQMITDLGSLEVLYAQKKITEKEYRDEVERLNAALAERAMLMRGAVTTHLTGGLGSIAGEGTGVTGNMLDSATPTSMPFDVEAFEKGAEDMKKSLYEVQASIADKAEEEAARTRDAWATGLGQIGASFIEMAAAGEKSFGEMTEKLLKQAAMLALTMGVSQIGGPGGKFLSQLIGGLGGFANGGGFMVPYDTDRFVLPRAANGLRGVVGGHGPTDSKIAMIRVTPGEYVDIRTPQQQAAAANSNSPMAVQVVAQMMNNERDIVEAGETVGAQKVFLRNKRRYGGRTR